MAHIVLQNLGVDFTVFGSSARSLKNTLMAHATGGRVMAGARDVVRVRALDNLNLQVRDGDRVGLVGHNGAGKTTLLRVLAGIYRPASGSLTVEGKVGTLIDVSAGLDPEATGVENIFLRGYLLRMTRREIEAQIADISDFTDLGNFLELPLKTYSAGMTARLVFAIATSAHSDILLIDEGIGAGDAAFQEKAQKRIERLFARTSIVMLATHSDDLIQKYCNRRVCMEHGRIVEDSRVSDKPA